MVLRFQRREVMKIAKKIKLNGPVVSGGNSWIYNWLGIETISPQRVISELEKASGDDVELYINSGGGSVPAGSEIYTALMEYRGKKISKITGMAASAATFFVLASDEVYVSPLAQMMIHNASTYTEGDKTAHASNLELLEGVDKAIAKVYQSKTKLPDNEVLELMKKTTWMNAEKSVQLGFANGILFEDEVEVSNNAYSGDELPQNVIDKLKNELVNSMLKNKDLLDPQLMSLIPEPMNAITLPTNERNDQSMNLEKLKAEHPDLYNSILNAGVKQGEEKERERIVALNTLANSPGAADIVVKAIANGTSAGDAAMEIVQASAKRVKDVAANREEDAENSGAAEVPAEEAPTNNNNKDQDAANLLMNAVQNMNGGK